MARKSGMASMSIEALFKLRDEIGEAIASRASELQKQLAKLTGTSRPKRKYTRKSARKGKKVAAQFRSKKDPKLTWAGRGATPLWMRDEMKARKLKKDAFLIK